MFGVFTHIFVYILSDTHGSKRLRLCLIVLPEVQLPLNPQNFALWLISFCLLSTRDTEEGQNKLYYTNSVSEQNES